MFNETFNRIRQLCKIVNLFSLLEFYSERIVLVSLKPKYKTSL